MDTWYRYDIVTYAPPVDEFDNICGPSRTTVVLHAYPVKTITPKGVRLINGRFVLRSATKKFACPTKEEAAESFRCRKKKHMAILSGQIEQIKWALQLLSSGTIEEISYAPVEIA